MNRLEQQMNFIREIDGVKQIFRQSYLSDGSRRENDAEHSWHLAVMALVMQEYANDTVDTSRALSMVLLHDIVELDAGDTFAYDDAGNTTKRKREIEAANRIFPLLPEDQAVYFYSLWEEFEEAVTPEARYAHMLDNIQPMLLNDASGGKSWKEHQVRLSQITKRNEHTAEGSQEIWDYAKKELLQKNIDKKNIIRDIAQ